MKNKSGFIKGILTDEKLKEFEMVKKFKSHNIIKERVELYKDFTINLLNYINDTYLGKEYIKTPHDIEGHFNWCYGKVLSEFDDEEISFYGNDELYDYFYGYFLDQFYQADHPEPLSHYEKFWENIFELRKNKNRKVFEVLLEVYEIFDKSINDKEMNENELELQLI
jgi:hypothetical protein